MHFAKTRIQLTLLLLSLQYWAFPSKAAKVRQVRVAKLESEIAAEEAKEAVLLEKRKAASQGREDGEERRTKLARHSALMKEQNKLQTELAAFAEVDPDRLAELQVKLKEIKGATNRWTDNLFCLKKYVQVGTSS